MRWDRLFDDLEAQQQAAEREDFDAEVADRTRRELALVSLAERLRPAVGQSVALTVEAAGPVSGVIRRVGSEWLLLQVAAAVELVVSSAAVVAIHGLPVIRPDGAPAGAIAARRDLGHALRAIARDRSAVIVTTREGSRWSGTIDRVGADFVDLAEHPIGEPRRASQVRGVCTLRTAAIATVRTT